MNERIALGFGNNIDYEIVWNSQVFKNLVVQYDIHDAELDIHRGIQSERDLLISILGFLKLGIGGERFVASSDIIEQFSQNFEKKVTLGGTSVRAAIAMRKFGYQSALHLVTLNDHVRSLIPSDSPYVCSNAKESSYPHLIVQFGKDTRVEAGDIDICASQANRLIYHSDDDNIVMNLNEDFASLITNAGVLLVSGFNAMQSEPLLVNRLESVLRIMQSLPTNAMVFCEDAGYYEPRFSTLIYKTLSKRLNILSLNEDELQGHLHKKLDLLDAAQIKQALAELQKLIPIPVIVVHSRHWSIAYGEDAPTFANALKAGVTLATTRFRCGDEFTVENYKEIENLPPARESALFADAVNKTPGSQIHCAPVAQVEQSNATTIGLGDTFVAGFLPALLSR